MLNPRPITLRFRHIVVLAVLSATPVAIVWQTIAEYSERIGWNEGRLLIPFVIIAVLTGWIFSLGHRLPPKNRCANCLVFALVLAGQLLVGTICFAVLVGAGNAGH